MKKMILNFMILVTTAMTLVVTLNSIVVGADKVVVIPLNTKHLSSKSGSVVIPAIAFVPDDENFRYGKTVSGNGFVNTAVPGYMVHSLPVPSGATITSLEAYFYDIVDSGYMEADIYLVEGIGTPSVIASVRTYRTEIYCDPCVKTSFATSHLINSNVTNRYSIRLYFSQGHSSLGAYAVKVNYNYTP